jgi:phage-related protein
VSDANIVGRIAVKVMPDTSEFKEDLKKKLEKIENDLAITIRTKANADGARADVLEAVRAINSDNKKSDTRKIRFYTKLDLTGMATEVRNAAQAYQQRANSHKIVFNASGRQLVQAARQAGQDAQAELGDLHVGVNLDSQGSVIAAVAKVRAAIEALGETDVQIGVNTDDLNAAVDMFEERLDEIKHITLRVDKDSQSSIQAAISQIDRELSDLRAVEIKVKLDRASLEAERKKLEQLLRLELKVDPRSTNSVKAAIARIDAELAKFKEIDLSVKMDEKSLKKARARLEKHLTLDVQVDKKSMSSVEGALKQIEDQLSDLGREEIKVKMDKRSLLTAQAEMKAILDAQIQAKVTADREAAQKARDEIQAQMDGIKVRPKLDEQMVAQTKRQLEAAFEQMQALKAKITPELDAMERRKVEREVEELQDKIKTLRSTIEPEVSRTGIMATIAHLAALSRDRVVELIPRVKLSAAATATAMLQALSGARVLGDMFERLGNSIKNLDRNAPVIGTLATAIAGLAGWGITAASNLFTMSASLAQIGATGLALPGILGGMAIGLGVTVAAFKDFNKVLPEVKGKFSELQNLISNNFWAKAKAPIRELIDTLIPELEAGFGKTSTQLGQFFGGFATAIQSTVAPALGGMFDDLSKSIEIATGGTATWANMIKILGEVGAGYLPRLAQWFVDISEKANAWMEKKGESGLRQEIDAGITALKDLGGILYEVGGIFAGIARAAQEAGGSTLGMIRSTLAGIHTAIDSSGVQDAMRMLFYAAHLAIEEIGIVGGPQLKAFLGEFVGLLTAVLPQVGNIIGTAVGAIASALNQPAVTEGIHAVFDGMQQAVWALAPAMAPLGAALGGLLTLVGSFLTMLGPLVAAVLTPLSEAFTMLVPAIEPLIGLLGDALGGVVAALAPLIMAVVTALVPLIDALVAGLAPIIPILNAAFATMSAALQPVVEILMAILTAAILPLIPVVQRLAAEFLPKISEAFAHVMEAIQPLLEKLKAVVDFIMPILVPAIEWLAGILLDSLVGALEGVATFFSGTFDFIMGIWNTFAGLFTGDWDRMWNGIKQIGSGLWDMIKGAFMVFNNVGILGVGKKILAGLKSLWDNIWNGVKGTALSIWASIKTNWSTFMTNLRNAPGEALRAIVKFFSDCWKTIKSEAGTAWEAVKKVFSQKIDDCVKFVKDIPKNVKQIFSDAKSLLVDAGKKIITGLIDGIKGMFSSVKSTLGDLTSKLTDWKGPAPKDARLLYDAGRLIIQGLIKGLESQYDSVKKSLNELTAKIPKNASKGLKDRINKDRTQLLKLAAQWEAGAKRLEAAQDKLDKLREDLANYAEKVRDKVISTGDVTKVQDATFETISNSLKNAVEEAKRFATVLAKLKKLGLNQTSFDQIAMAGPEAGLAAAEALANAGASGVAEINDLQKELEKYATKAGSTAAHYMYDAGIQAAEGLVKGLEAQQSAIEKQMLKIADAMVAAIKKALDIHSPSRLFRKLGSFVGRGFSLGVTDERGRVERATNALASSATSGASRGVVAAVSGGLSMAGSGQAVTKVLNYYAGNGSSISSEEELFAATSRARMVGW